VIASGTLAVIGGIHAVWSLGSPFPFRSRAELADAVIGTDVVHSPAACRAVAAGAALPQG
jgi:hypothetical protein